MLWRFTLELHCTSWKQYIASIYKPAILHLTSEIRTWKLEIFHHMLNRFPRRWRGLLHQPKWQLKCLGDSRPRYFYKFLFTLITETGSYELSPDISIKEQLYALKLEPLLIISAKQLHRAFCGLFIFIQLFLGMYRVYKRLGRAWNRTTSGSVFKKQS